MSIENKIPLPTDNIYKFYALFGLVLLISSMSAFLYVHTTTNELAFQAAIEYEELAAKEHPTPPEAKRKELIEKRATIATKDRDTYNIALGLIFGAGTFFMVLGFWKWEREVQPRQDRLLDLQIQKAEQDLKPAPRSPLRGREGARK